MLDFSDFYNGIRFVAVFLKFMYNGLFLSIHIIFLVLGIVEDRLNIKLNKILKTQYFTKISSKSDMELKLPILGVGENVDNCTICMLDFSKKDLVCSLPCSMFHKFHVSCLEQWFRGTITCPICRYDPTKDEKFKDDKIVFNWMFKPNIFLDENSRYHNRMVRDVDPNADQNNNASNPNNQRSNIDELLAAQIRHQNNIRIDSIRNNTGPVRNRYYNVGNRNNTNTNINTNLNTHSNINANMNTSVNRNLVVNSINSIHSINILSDEVDNSNIQSNQDNQNSQNSQNNSN